MSRNPIFLFALLFVVVGVSACKDDSTGPTAFRVEGTWGAEHIVLTADRSGGTLEYDCAVGTIDQPLIVGSDGQFDLVGTHTRGAGLPVHQGELPDIHPARYSGHVSGNTMTLTVRLTDTGDVLGPYTIVHGNGGSLYLCR